MVRLQELLQTQIVPDTLVLCRSVSIAVVEGSPTQSLMRFQNSSQTNEGSYLQGIVRMWY